MRTILLFSLESINNVGDEILRATTEFLIKSVNPNLEINLMQLKPRKTDVCGSYRIDWAAGRLVRKFAKFIHGKTLSYKIRYFSYIIAYERLFESRIRRADKIILPIGMLKYSTQDFCYLFYIINKLATKYHKDVMMSAMSPQAPNRRDWRYHLLVKAVNFPSVKMVTTRDGMAGAEIIKCDYLKREIECDYVGDPALWIPETYKVKKGNGCNGVPYVGINIIRRGIFKDYNNSSTDDQLKCFYINLIRLLEQKHWRWSVFCNGMLSDMRVINELQTELGFSAEHIVNNFTDGKSYAEIVSNFDVILGARLHACITSVAVGTPVVGFVWDDKLKHFSETMKIGQFFFQPSNMTAEKVVAKLEEALNFNFDFENRDKYKQRTKESIKHFLMMN